MLMLRLMLIIMGRYRMERCGFGEKMRYGNLRYLLDESQG